MRCKGDGRLECVTIRNRADGSLDDVDVHAVFIFIGADAITDWLPKGGRVRRARLRLHRAAT